MDSMQRFQSLADVPFEHNRPTEQTASTLMDELLFQRATQTYLWAMPLLNTMGMRDGFAQSYGATYNTMAIWTKRSDARTLITTPNADVIYAHAFVNLAETGALVFDVPPRLQGILLDMWQRPIPVDGGQFAGDVGLPGPDAGQGGKFLILPPGYTGDVPTGHYVYRSGTNNVFFFLRSFYSSPDDTSPAVVILKQSRIYPLGQKETAEPMKFEDASATGHEMLPRVDATAFQQLKYLVETEGSHLADPDWLGMLASLGIVQGKPFAPDARTQEILAHAAMTAYKMSRVLGLQGSSSGVDFRVYEDRRWVNPVNNRAARWPNSLVDLSWAARSGGFRDLDTRAWYFTNYYSVSPGMVTATPGKGAHYMIGFADADGKPLEGTNSYRLTLPPNIPAGLFWSVTLYEAENGSMLDNGQPFPALSSRDNPAPDAEGSTTLYIGPNAPRGAEANWIATVPGRGFFAILRLYAPTESALDGSWKPGDFEPMG